MDEPLWVDEATVLEFHYDQLAEFGGLDGIRDAGLLTSALNRPRFVWAYTSPKPDLARLAASYAYGIAKNHPFFDGNKRTALILCHTFLRLNGHALVASQTEQVHVILKLAAGDMDESSLEAWLRLRIEKRDAAAT
jgi:death-on-curing protein